MMNATQIGLATVDAVDGKSVGIAAGPDGFVALTLSESKHFKTQAGAVRWLAKRGYKADGTRASAGLPFGVGHVDDLVQPFCACGHVRSNCDRSRKGCTKVAR